MMYPQTTGSLSESKAQPSDWRMGLFSRGKGITSDTDTLMDERLDTRTEEDLEAGDHERFSHYVRKDKIVESAVSGKPVTALCGKRWIPSRDPMKFPICPTCKEIHAGLRKEPNDSNDNEKSE